MAYTLAEARTRARTDYLDDPQGDRWPDAVMDRHLKYARHRTLTWLANSGYTEFNTRLTLSPTSSQLDLSSYDVVKVKSVLQVNGVHRQKLKHVPLYDIKSSVGISGNFEVHLIAYPTFPATDGTAFINVEGTNPDIEELIVLRACESALVIDGEVPQHLVNLMLRLERDVKKNSGAKRSQPLPRAQGPAKRCWSWDPENNAIVLSNEL